MFVPVRRLLLADCCPLKQSRAADEPLLSSGEAAPVI